ncbi:GNAT family N-acetyltransferase [Acidothermaceae bacterium B102]|nr:GNAT family N-acetyltransferase [Acidothermaceae bacterium B102]
MPISDLLIRPALAADVEAVTALVQGAYRGDTSRAGWTTEADLLDGQRIDVDEVAAKLGHDSTEVLVAVTAEGAVVACCEIERRPEGAYFGMFAVDPRQQSSGIGRRVLEAAEARAVALWSASTMEMTVIEQRSELIAWYERRGYRLTGERRPFPYGDVSKGLPRRPDLVFVVLAKTVS